MFPSDQSPESKTKTFSLLFLISVILVFIRLTSPRSLEESLELDRNGLLSELLRGLDLNGLLSELLRGLDLNGLLSELLWGLDLRGLYLWGLDSLEEFLTLLSSSELFTYSRDFGTFNGEDVLEDILRGGIPSGLILDSDPELSPVIVDLLLFLLS